MEVLSWIIGFIAGIPFGIAAAFVAGLLLVVIRDGAQRRQEDHEDTRAMVESSLSRYVDDDEAV